MAANLGIPEPLSVEVIASRFLQNRRPIRDCLNVDALEPHMRERFMLTADDRNYLRCNLTHKPKAEYILGCVEERSLFEKFVDSVRSETTHLGHEYVKAILEGSSDYCSDGDLHKAADIRRKVESNMSKMMDIDLPSLAPLLYSQFLLTKDERTLLTAKSEVQNQNALQFFDILETKGPLAYLKFVQCLSQEPSHPTHRELYELLCQATEGEELALAICESPTKRKPSRVVMEGALTQKKYKRRFAMMKEALYRRDWEAVKQGVDWCMQSEIPEVRVVGLLENAFSWVVRFDQTKVLTIIKQVKELCEMKVNGSNVVFLRARAELVVSVLYRYLKQDDKAVEYATNAMVLLFNAEPGQDSAKANYDHACALAAKRNPSDAAQIMREFTFAMDIGLADQATSCSSNKWSQIVAYKSLIRQAMLLLDSNNNVPGITDKIRQENITKAGLLLSKLNVHSLSNRMKCLYYLAESEIHTQKEEVKCAIKTATQAWTLATKCGFACLLLSANTKLSSLTNTCA